MLKELLQPQTYGAMKAAQLRAQAESRDKQNEDSTPIRPAESGPIWQPQHRRDCRYSFTNPGNDCDCPQVLAANSPADILGYGGEAGGGKTDLLLGVAGKDHARAVIFRREFPRLRQIVDRSRQIYNREGMDRTRDSYNEALHIWRLLEDKQIEFGAVQYEKDKEDWQGRAHDFYGFDEATEFLESQVRFIIGWLRSTRAGQRCRVILTFNPPMGESGQWVVEFFKPWLAYLHPKVFSHPRPAKPGELRWYTTGPDGKDIECPNGEPFVEVSTGEIIRPLSRSFIPAKLKDNPILESTGYARQINAMPEPYRSRLKGDYSAGIVDDPWQAIPRAWVLAAMARWRPTRPNYIDPQTGRETPIPQIGLGADVARGGDDQTVFARLYGLWFAPLLKYDGKETPTAQHSAQLALSAQENNAIIGVDVVGVGSGCFDQLAGMGANVYPISPGSGPTKTQTNNGEIEATDSSGVLRFLNLRAEMVWKLREALDPVNGFGIALPDDPELLADLCAPKWWLSGGKIQIEGKEEDKDKDGKKGGIKQRLGRSPNSGDAVTYAWHVATRPIPNNPRVVYDPVRIGNY